LRKRARILGRPASKPAKAVESDGAGTNSAPNSEATTAAFLGSYGVKFPSTAEVKSADEAAQAAEKIGFPVVLKAVLPGVLHKSDVGGVKTGLGDADAVRAAARSVEQSVSAKLGSGKLAGYLVAQDLGRQRELFVGVRRDHSLGSIGVLGVGGVYAEAIGDTSVCLLPATADSVKLCLSKLRSRTMWGSFRGEPEVDPAKVADVLNQLGSALESQPDCTAIECNPVMPVGRDLLAVDAAMEFAGRESRY
jgi:acetyltransferase